jgi:hypothetical protein
MIPADLALALLINRTTQAYVANAPAFISYRERTRITATIGRTQEIDRLVSVRNADDFAIMRDLPQGGERTGQAFPIIPYFDPFSSFDFSYFANLKQIIITINRRDPMMFPIPQPDPTVDIVVPYASFWAPRYAADSSDAMLHLMVDPTPKLGNNDFYPSEVIEDPSSHLPSHVELHDTGSDMTIALDYSVIDGHWVVTHGTFTSTEHVSILGTFKVKSETVYDQFAFSPTPPDPRLAGPAPAASASP